MTMALSMLVSTPLSAFAEEIPEEFQEEVILEGESEETEAEVETEEIDTAEEILTAEGSEEPETEVQIREANQIPVEFVNFGNEIDKLLKDDSEAYTLSLTGVSWAKNAGRFDEQDEFETDVYLDKYPKVENGVLKSIYANDNIKCGISWYDDDRIGIHFNLSKSFLKSTEPIKLTAVWDMEVLENNYTLDANGGVFSNDFYGNSTIIYKLVDFDQSQTFDISYSEDMTKAYIPVVKNGYFPIPERDAAGIYLEANGRPYDGDVIKPLGWNTKKDGTGDFYSTEKILVARYKPQSLTLYAIFPEYYAASFILDGKEYLGGYWDAPHSDNAEGLQHLYEMAFEGTDKAIFEKEGYTLSWYLDEDCTIPADFSNRIDSCENMDDILKVYGKWTEIVKEPERVVNSYTVNFANIDGASLVNENTVYDAEKGIKLEKGETLNLAKYAYKKNGYTFKNWTAVIDGKNKLFAKNAKIKDITKNYDSTITLTANWTKNTYKITYKLDGGKQVKAPTKYDIETGAELVVPTKKGYELAGWDVKRDGKKVVDATELNSIYDSENNRILPGAYGNLELTAKYNPFGYKIVFHVPGYDKEITLDGYGKDKLVAYTDTVNFDFAAVDLKDIVKLKRDEQITGFSRKEGGKIEFVREKNYSKLTSDEKELHLYATVSEDTYYINYNLGKYEGATLSKNMYTYKGHNKKSIALPTAKCPGYKFYGWEFNEDHKSLFKQWVHKYTGWGEYDFATYIAPYANNDIELYPHFEPNKIKVYVSPNASDVYEEVWSDRYEDYRPKRVASKRANAVWYYNGGQESDWCDESMNDWFRYGYSLAGFSTNPKAKPDDKLLSLKDDLGGLATSGSATIYCIWKPETYDIRYAPAVLKVNGEEKDGSYNSDSFPKSYTNGKAVTLPTVEIEGYDFLGWVSADIYGDDPHKKFTKKGGYITKINANSCYDVMLAPVFKRQTYDLSFNAQGGKYKGKSSGLLKKGLDYSEDVSSLVSDFSKETFTRKGYKLQGFSLDSKGATGFVLDANGKPIYKSHKVVLKGNKKATIYAIWKKL